MVAAAAAVVAASKPSGSSTAPMPSFSPDQLFLFGSKRFAQFLAVWKRIVFLLDRVANTGSVELGHLQLAAYFAEKKPTGQPFFRNGLPSVVAFPPDCKTADCVIQFDGELSVDAVTDWFSTTMLGLP